MAYDEKYRRQAIAYKESGHTFKELEAVFGIVSQTYYNWKRLLEQTGTLQYSPPKTRKRKTGKEKKPAEAVKKRSGSYLSEYAEMFGCTPPAGIRRLEETEDHFKKKSFACRERPEEERNLYIKRLKRVPVKKRVYADESGINEALQREYGRAPRGERVEEAKPGRKFQRINVIGAYGGGRTFAELCYAGSTDGDFFERRFEERLVGEAEEGSTIILDNASFHRKKRLKKMARKAKLRILELFNNFSY